MFGLKKYDALFVGWSFFLQIVLIVHFAVRKRYFETYTIKFGWLVYALCIPGLLVSFILIAGRQPWYFWLGGILFTAFAIFGYYIDYVKGIPWRNPLVPSIMAPYVTLYLGSLMFYWWPLVRINKTFWYVYAAFYMLSTILNITSH